MATWELLSNPSAEDLLRAMLVEGTGPTLDRALFVAAPAAPAAADRPAGLLNGIAPLPSTGNLTNDLIMLLAAVAPVAGNSRLPSLPAQTGLQPSTCCPGRCLIQF